MRAQSLVEARTRDHWAQLGSPRADAVPTFANSNLDHNHPAIQYTHRGLAQGTRRSGRTVCQSGRATALVVRAHRALFLNFKGQAIIVALCAAVPCVSSPPLTTGRR